jgi:hypothetical protein
VYRSPSRTCARINQRSRIRPGRIGFIENL